MDDKLKRQIDTDELLDLFAIWRHDGITPLTFIKGYADILSQELESVGSLTNEQRKCVEIIQQNVQRAADRWNYPSNYLRYQYGEIKPNWQKMNLSTAIIEDVLRNLEWDGTLSISIDVSDSLPAVKGEYSLLFAFEAMIHPRYFYSSDCVANIEAELGENDKIDVEILLEVDIPDEGLKNLDNLFYSGGHLSVAKLILEKLYKSPIEVSFPKTGIVFRFSLPTWNPEVGIYLP